MSDSPFFSIVVPTYNRADIILSTLSGILNQRFKDFEIVVVDDGSTDQTSELLKSYQEKNNQVKVITQKNSERGAARNTGFKNSKGSYVLFFDSDDRMHENHLETLFEHISLQSQPLFIASKFDFIDEEGKTKPSDMKNISQGYYDYKLFLNGNPLACNICVKKNNPDLYLFIEDRKYAIKEDWMYMLQNLQNAKLFIIDKVTISMFDHSKRSMRSDNSIIISRTNLAKEWILTNIKLDQAEQKMLNAHVNYFCSIHSYLDSKRIQSMKYALNAISYGGIKMKYLVMLLKGFAGRKLIAGLK